MLLGSLSGEELAGALHDGGDVVISPLNSGGVLFGVESDLLSVDDDSVFGLLDVEGESHVS